MVKALVHSSLSFHRTKIQPLAKLLSKLLFLLLPLSCRAKAAAASQHGVRFLHGQRVLVTGAGRGIGQAIAVLCGREGAKVALTSRSRSELEITAEQVRSVQQQQQGLPVCENDDRQNKQTQINDQNDSVLILPADLLDQDQIDAMVDEIVAAWGGIDILINNAGGAQATTGSSETLDSNDFLRVLELNVVATHRVSKAVLNKAMLPAQGTKSETKRQIINISSRAGKVGLPNYSFYVASKFALEGMTASMAAEFQDRNIQVNSISPGMVDTKSFPKHPGQPGVRSAESISDGLFVLLQSDVTGHYLHVDELDLARIQGLPDSSALKPINEQKFGD